MADDRVMILWHEVVWVEDFFKLIMLHLKGPVNSFNGSCMAQTRLEVQFRQMASSYSHLCQNPPVNQRGHAPNCVCSHAGCKHVYFLLLQALVDVRGTAGFGASALASFFCPGSRCLVERCRHRAEVLTKTEMQSRSVSSGDWWHRRNTY